MFETLCMHDCVALSAPSLHSGVSMQMFYHQDGGVTHPLPSKEFMAWREAADKAYEEEQASLIPGL